MALNLGFLFLTLIINPWSWQIFSNNFFLFLLTWIASITLFISAFKIKKLYILFWILLISLLIWQILGTKNFTFQNMSSTEANLWNSRRGILSDIQFNLFGYEVNPNLGRYLQGKPSFLVYKFQENFFRTLDPNEYFFGGHPRERTDLPVFEKFVFIFIPFFIVGMYTVILHQQKQLLLSLIIPLLVIIFMGSDNLLSVFSLFPFLSVTTALGIKKVFSKYVKSN